MRRVVVLDQSEIALIWNDFVISVRLRKPTRARSWSALWSGAVHRRKPPCRPHGVHDWRSALSTSRRLIGTFLIPRYREIDGLNAHAESLKADSRKARIPVIGMTTSVRGGAGNLNTAISGTLCEINPGLRARESRMDHEQETPQEPLTAVQGQGGGGRHQGREDVGRAGQVARCAPQPDR